MITFTQNQPITFEHLDAVKELADRIKRVREVHRPINGPADDVTCSECAVDENNYPQYPCPTIRALDGGEQ